MAFTSPSSHTIPGSFIIDHTPPSKLDTITRERPCIYQTPSTSSSLHLSSTSSTSATPDDNSSRSRKRLRRDSTNFEPSTPYAATPNEWTDLASGQSSVTSPAPFVNTRYLLAGGLDTPTGATASAFELDDYGYTHSRIPYQRGCDGEGRVRASQQDGYFPYVPAALSRESNGRTRAHHPPVTQDGWSRTVFDVLGGVAGKVWDFCTATAFRGFYAGGGTGFQIRPAEDNMRQYVVEREDSSSANDRECTPIPGHFPDADVDFLPEHTTTNSHTHSTPPRPAKKLQRLQGEGSLKANWVLVSSTPRTRSTSPFRSPTRKTPATTARSPERRRPPPARSLVSKASHAQAQPPPRRPILPASSRTPSHTSPSLAGSPALHPYRPASFASPRSPGNTPAGKASASKKSAKGVSLSPEARAYQAQARRREVRDDQSMRRLNARLKDMIREGKEALGSRVEVEMGDAGCVDEGYAEGEGQDFVGKGRW